MIIKRLAIFASYDKENIIDDYVIYYLKELNKFSDIIFVSDCEMPESELKKIKDYTIKAISKRHGEYDFGSYKRGYIYAKEKGILENYNYLILCNDSNFGPIYSFDYIFKDISCDKNTVYGAFLYKKSKHIDEHLQSHFIIIPKNIFLSDWYSDFILSIKKEKNKFDIIEKYEIGMSILFKKHGINLSALHSFNDNVPQINPLELIEENYIFFKKVCYRLNIKYLYKILNIIKSSYDINLILNYYEHYGYYIIDKKELIELENKLSDRDYEKLKLRCGWFSIFNIYNNSDTLRIVIFGIKISIKMTPQKMDKFLTYISIKNWINIIRNKLFDNFIRGVNDKAYFINDNYLNFSQ